MKDVKTSLNDRMSCHFVTFITYTKFIQYSDVAISI